MDNARSPFFSSGFDASLPGDSSSLLLGSYDASAALPDLAGWSTAAAPATTNGAPQPVWNGSGATTLAVGATGNQDIDGVLAGVQWSSANLTFSFPSAASQYGAYSSGETSTFLPVNPTMQTAIRYALGQYASVSNLQFTELTGASAGNATIRFGMSDSAQPTAYAYYPWGDAQGGDVWFGTQTDVNAMTSPAKGNYAWISMMHELGHALGLKHGQETGGPANTTMTTAHDSMEYSVMTYLSYVGAAATGYTNEKWGYAQSLMMYDIAAIQDMYGANFSGPSNTVYKWDPTTGQEFINGVGQGAPGGNRVFMTVWDGGGNAEYDFSNYTAGMQIDLTPGGYSKISNTQLANLGNSNYAHGNVYNALQYNGDTRSLIRFVKAGAGADTIIGNAADNVIDGGGGSDTITGGGGADVFLFTASELAAPAAETLSDYVDGADVIRLEGIDPTKVTAGGSLATPKLSIVAPSGATTSFNLTAQASGLIDVVVASSVTSDMRTLATTSLANTTVLTFDLNAAHTWRERMTTVDALGRATTQTLLNYNGTTTSLVLDPGTGALVSALYSKLSGTPYNAYELDYTNGTFSGYKYYFSGVTGQVYTGYETDYDTSWQLTHEVFTGVTSAPFTSYATNFTNGTFVGYQYYYTNVSGQAYTGFETDYSPQWQLTHEAFTGVTGAAYSSYAINFSNGTFTGYQYFFTGVTGQAYTGYEIDYNPQWQMTREIFTGVTSLAFSSYALAFSNGAFAGYQYFFTGVSGQSYTGYEYDYNASWQLTRAIYSGYKIGTYSALETDYVGGVQTAQVAYNNDGSHTITGFQNAVTFSSIYNDTITGGGTGEKFVFTAGFGHDTVTDLTSHLTGAGHDTVQFSTSQFANFASMLSATTDTAGGAQITTASGDVLLLSGVTKLQMSANATDFSFA